MATSSDPTQRLDEFETLYSKLGEAPDVAELKRAVAAKVAESTGLRVGQVAVVQAGSLPKTSSGKVQRRKTKAKFEAGELEEHAGEVVLA